MDQFEKRMFDIINRNYDCVATVDRIEKNLDCDLMARKLNAISKKRRYKTTNTTN